MQYDPEYTSSPTCFLTVWDSPVRSDSSNSRYSSSRINPSTRAWSPDESMITSSFTISAWSISLSSPSLMTMTFGLMRRAILSNLFLAFISWMVAMKMFIMMTAVAAKAFLGSPTMRRIAPSTNRMRLNVVQTFFIIMSLYERLTTGSTELISPLALRSSTSAEVNP